MDSLFKKKADEIKIQPSDGTWAKINTHLQYSRVVKERNLYRKSLSIVASVAILSVVLNAMYISDLININSLNDTYIASSSLARTESGEPFHMSAENLDVKEDSESPVKRIQVKKH